MGYVFGALLICPLLDKFNSDIVYCACLLAAGLTTLAMPLCNSLLFFAVLFGARSFFVGPAISGSPVLLNRTWLHSAGPYLQNMQLFFALGGLVAPLVTAPFLVDRLPYTPNTILLPYAHLRNSSPITNYTMIKSTTTDRIHVTPIRNESRVYVTFLIACGLLLGVVVAFVVKICFHSSGDFDRLDKSRERTISESERPNLLALFPTKAKTICYIFLTINSVSYGCVAKVLMSFLMTFAVEYLHMSKNSGLLANTVMWAAYAFGRFPGIFLITLFGPQNLLIIDFIDLLVTCTAMALVRDLPHGRSVWWGLIASSGLFLGSVLASMVSWLDTTLTRVTGTLMTLLFVGNMVGMFTHMPLLGYLFANITPLWFVYLLVIHSTLLLLTFLGLVAVTKYFTFVLPE